MSRRESTRERLRRTALALFAERGFDAVSVAQVARAAGVSHMTFFRHFPTKEAAVVGDLFDPVIAEAVRAQPEDAAPLARAVRGLVAALADEEGRAELASAEFRERIRLAASTPSLRAAVWAAGQETERAIAAALGGADLTAAPTGTAVQDAAPARGRSPQAPPSTPASSTPAPATPAPSTAERAAAGAVMGAATAILLAWADGDGRPDAAAALTDGLLGLLGGAS